MNRGSPFEACRRSCPVSCLADRARSRFAVDHWASSVYDPRSGDWELPSEPCMTAWPSIVQRYHRHARPRFLRRISKREVAPASYRASQQYLVTGSCGGRGKSVAGPAQERTAQPLKRTHDRSPMLSACLNSLLASLTRIRSIISPFLSLTAPWPSAAAVSTSLSRTLMIASARRLPARHAQIRTTSCRHLALPDHSRSPTK